MNSCCYQGMNLFLDPWRERSYKIPSVCFVDFFQVVVKPQTCCYLHYGQFFEFLTNLYTIMRRPASFQLTCTYCSVDKKRKAFRANLSFKFYVNKKVVLVRRYRGFVCIWPLLTNVINHFWLPYCTYMLAWVQTKPVRCCLWIKWRTMF